MRPLRLTHEKQEDRQFGPYCEFFLDGEPLDLTTLFVADEWLGYIEEGRALGSDTLGSGFSRWELDPATQKPRLYRREGRVEIRLKEEAPEAVRQLYAARRAE